MGLDVVKSVKHNHSWGDGNFVLNKNSATTVAAKDFEYGVWHGHWSVVSGQWSVVSGLCLVFVLSSLYFALLG